MARSVLSVVRAHAQAFLQPVGRRICGVPSGPGFRYSRGGDPAVAVGLVALYGRLRSASAYHNRGIPTTSSWRDSLVLLPRKTACWTLRPNSGSAHGRDVRLR